MASKFPPKRPDNSHIIKPRVQHTWSSYQKIIFKDINSGIGNTVVIARAGSSKTTSLVEGSRYIPKGKSALYCAFNKSIQEELSARLSERIQCSTLHSLGFRAIKLRFGNIELNNRKCFEIVESFFSSTKDNYDLIENICKTIDLCKATLTDIPSQIEEVIEEYGIDLCEVEIKEFIKYVCSGLRKCKEQTNQIDFNDMIWFCFVYKLNVGKFDFVFIDEAHDLSKAQIELALSAVKPNGRVIAVLDDFQAIYSWRGADSKVLDNFKERLSPKELKLPICYRCPKKVVTLAQKFVPDIMPFEDSKDGEIINIDISDLQKYAKPGSYVLSRVNAPLIKHCLNFIKNGIPANILGRDIGEGLIYLIKKSKKKNVESFLKWLNNWSKNEKERLSAKYQKMDLSFIDDKVECFHNLCEGLSSLDEVKTNINNLFKDAAEKDIVLFSSIHKIKGKESDIVLVLADTLRASSQEENNLQYVAFTRSKSKLYLVRKPNKYTKYDNISEFLIDPNNGDVHCSDTNGVFVDDIYKYE